MSEFSRSGGRLPHDPQAEADHERDLRDAAEHEHVAAEAARAANPSGPQPWWAFWRRRARR